MKQFILSVVLTFILSVSLWAQSNFGLSLSLDGNGDQASIPTPEPSITSFTIEAWVKVDTNSSGYKTIYASSSGFFLKDRKINWYQGADRYVGSIAITQFEWNHIAVTYNGNVLMSYINGVFNSSSNFTGGQLPIFGVGIGGNTVASEYFDGLIDELRIWNYARSQNQIDNTMNDTLGTAYYSTADSGLIGYWRFDTLEDLGINNDGADDVRDYSIYSNHCDLVGDATLETSIPVELISFSAIQIDNTVLLNWQTATETNNNGFEIERTSIDNSNVKMWNTVGFVSGSGTTTEPKVYIFTDEIIAAGKYQYRLKQIDFDGSFEYSNEVEVTITVPEKFELSQNYPNPFNPTTKIRYSIPSVTLSGVEGSRVQLKIYDVLGNEVATLVNEEKPAGIYEVEFSAKGGSASGGDASGLASGMYLYRLQAGSFVETKKMIFLK